MSRISSSSQLALGMQTRLALPLLLLLLPLLPLSSLLLDGSDRLGEEGDDRDDPEATVGDEPAGEKWPSPVAYWEGRGCGRGCWGGSRGTWPSRSKSGLMSMMRRPWTQM